MTKNKSMKTNTEIVTSDSGRGKTNSLLRGISQSEMKWESPPFKKTKHTPKITNHAD